MMTPERFSALLAMVAARPNDRTMAALAADELLEAGDPRGEFISLSLQGNVTARKRAEKLFKRHRAAWLGPLNDVTIQNDGVEVWEHGFPVRLICRLEGLAKTEGAPQWLTVRELWLQAPREAERRPVVLAHAVTANVQRVQPVAAPRDLPRSLEWWRKALRIYLIGIDREALLHGPIRWP